MNYLAKKLDLHLLRRAVSAMLAMLMLFVNCSYVYAVSGPDVVQGGADISLGDTTTVMMQTSQAIINWDSLDTQSHQMLQFLKDSGNFAVLNRVMQGGATQFDGKLFGPQGHIIFINPQGIIFGPGASVMAGKFTASSLDMSNADFMDGRYNFTGDGVGEVANYGNISAEQVALIGKKVLNAGTISSPGGYTIMAAGDRVFLGAADSDIVVEVAGITTPQDGLGDVINEGTIDAPGGKIILAAGDTFSRAINGLEGLSVAVESGSGRVGQFGTLNAGNGGSITLTAGDVVVLGSGSITSANAAANGDGGNVIVYSPGMALFRDGALIEAKGGSLSGNGGFIEMSGKNYVEIEGRIDLTAAAGDAGTFLIDPRNIKVVADGSEEGGFNNSTDIWRPWDDDYGDGEYSRLPISRLETYLSYSNVILETDYSSCWNSQTGWVWFDAGRDVLNSANTSLTVNALNWIKLDSGINFTGGGNIVLNAYGDINVNSAVNTGGNLTLFADFNHNVQGDMHSADGVTLTAGGNIDIRGNDIIMGGAVDAGGNLTITGRDCNPVVWGNVHAKDTLTAGGNIEISDTGKIEGEEWVQTGKCSGYWRPYTDYFPGTITLDGDVTAGGNISLYNNTYATNVTGNGVTLQAGGDIMLKEDGVDNSPKDNCKFLKGTHYLALVAGGTIQASDDTYIEVTGSTLKLEQSPDLNLKNFWLGNQSHTDLIANSTAGSVTAVDTAHGGKTANAADKWKSVESTAYNNITLQGNGDIRAKALTSTYQGNIAVTSGQESVYANGPITTNQGDISVQASKYISLNQDVSAGGAITLTAVGKSYSSITANGKLETKAGSGGNITAVARDDIFLNHTPNSAIADGDITLTADSDNGNGPYSGDLVVKGNLQAGGNIALSASDDTIILGGDYVKAAGDIVLNDNTELNKIGDQRIEATGGTLTAKQDIDKTKSGDLNLAGGAGIVLGGDVSTSNGNLVFENAVTANGWDGQVFDAEGSGKKLISQSSITKTTAGDLTLDGGWNTDAEIEIGGDVTVTGGNGKYRYGDLYLGENYSYNDETTVAAGTKLEATNGDVRAANDVFGEGDLTIKAGDDIRVYGDVYVAGRLEAYSGLVSGQESEMTVNGDVTAETMYLRAGNGALDGYKLDTINIYGDAETTVGDMEMESDDHIYLGGDVTSQGNVRLIANTDEPTGGNIGDVTVRGDIFANGFVEIDAADNTIYLYGDTDAYDYVWLMANTKLKGDGGQRIQAGSWIRADGYVRKCTGGDMWMLAWGADEAGRSIDLRYDGDGPGVSTHQGNLWIVGTEDVQISGDVTTFGPDYSGWTPDYCGWETGGVLIYSENGSIYTGAVENGLNVNVTGNSDHWAGLGVYNPYFEPYYGDSPARVSDIYQELFGRAAIAVISAENLKLGPNGSLNAYGRYYDDVDDRALINFLDIPANIGGYDRNQGDPFDLAIYVASLDGDVSIDMPVQIRSREWVPVDGGDFGDDLKIASLDFGYWQCVPKGAMVADAWDTVTFGDNFESSLADGLVGDRLEVVSRISEWLEDAFGRLPYANPAEGAGPFPAGYNYVLRGAGLENPAITDGRAWVLESLGVPPAPVPRPLKASSAGCPVLMDAAAAELGVNTSQVAVWFEGGLEFNPEIHPCEACAALLAAANVLKDADGTHLAAMNQVFTAMAPADMPFTPEMSASIATAFADMPKTDSQYAMAAEYVDAFVKYMAVLDRQLNAPMGDSTEFVLSKYGQGVLGNANTNVSAYIQARLAEIGG